MKPNKTQSVEHESRAWSYRCQGWSQPRIAAALGISQPGVSKILTRVEARELTRLSGSIERIKVHQTGELEHVIEECLDAWHRSKTAKKRATMRQHDGADQTTTEAVDRDGETGYLYCAMNAMGQIRSLWGLDVAPALQDPAASVAELARDLVIRGAAYEARRQKQAAAGDSAGVLGTAPDGADALLPGPEPV